MSKFQVSSFKFPILFALAFAAALTSRAQQAITASITITNSTTNGVVFTLNGDTRTFTNNVANPATQVLTNSDVTGVGSKTNLLTQIQLTPFAQVVSVDTGSNSFNLIGNADLPMAVSLTAGYATVSYSTQTVAETIALEGPVSALPSAQARTNVASDIVGGVNSVENTNQISQNSTAAAQLLGTTNTQAVTGQKTFSNTNGIWNGVISNIVAEANWLIGGYWANGIFNNPTLTNGVNYGSAFSSPGAGANSEQFGSGASATGDQSTSVGYQSVSSGLDSAAFGETAVASGFGSVAFGNGSQAKGTFSIGVGANAVASGVNSSAFGVNSLATTNGAMAFGVGAYSLFTNSISLGPGSSNTAPNQIMLGGTGVNVVVQNDATLQGNASVGGNVTVSGNAAIAGLQTNGTFTGQVTLTNASLAFIRSAVSSLASGNNAAVPIGTNVFIEVSGPTGAFAINGIANGRDGKLIIIENATGQTMTIANQSGTDPTAANRILTGLSGDYANTNNPGCVTLIYNANVSRWILVSHN